MDEEFRQKYLASVRTTIAKHGWAVQGVADTPPFFYTIGLSAQDLPELFISLGLHIGDAGLILNNVAHCMAKGNLVLENFKMISDVIEGFPVVVREIMANDTQVNFGVLNAIYGRKPRKMFQIMLPDKSGRFPWDAGCSIRDDQLARGLAYVPLEANQ